MANAFKVICGDCPYRSTWPTREQASADAAKHAKETSHSVGVDNPPFSGPNCCHENGIRLGGTVGAGADATARGMGGEWEGHTMTLQRGPLPDDLGPRSARSGPAGPCGAPHASRPRADHAAEWRAWHYTELPADPRAVVVHPLLLSALVAWSAPRTMWRVRRRAGR